MVNHMFFSHYIYIFLVFWTKLIKTINLSTSWGPNDSWVDLLFCKSGVDHHSLSPPSLYFPPIPQFGQLVSYARIRKTLTPTGQTLPNRPVSDSTRSNQVSRPSLSISLNIYTNFYCILHLLLNWILGTKLGKLGLEFILIVARTVSLSDINSDFLGWNP